MDQKFDLQINKNQAGAELCQVQASLMQLLTVVQLGLGLS